MRRKSSSHLRFESLENRINMAGNVTTSVFFNSLFINGSSGNDQISIAPQAGGKVVVTGLNGTTVNGNASATLNGVLHATTIALRGGNDTVNINGGTYLGSVIVADKAGSNTVNVNNATVTGSLIITAASQDGNTVAVNGGSVVGNFGIYTGNGVDDIDVTGVRVSTAAQVVSGGGSDNVRISGSTVANSMVVDTGLRLGQSTQADDDIVTLSGNTFSRLTLTTGTGSDTVTMSNVHVLNRVQVSTGAGADNVTISGSTFDKALLSLTGGDDDELTISHTTVRGKTTLQGGEGNDTFVNGGGNTFSGGLSEDFEA